MNKGLRMLGLAASASAVKPLVAEAGIESEFLKRFPVHSSGIAAFMSCWNGRAGRLTKLDERSHPPNLA